MSENTHASKSQALLEQMGRIPLIVQGKVSERRSGGKVTGVKLQRWRDEDDKKGAIRWSGPVLASDRLLLTSSNGQMVSVSPYTGELLASEKIGSTVYLPPVVAGGMIYVQTDDGRLIAWR